MMDRRSAYPPMIRPSCGCARLEVYVPARWSVNSLQCEAVGRPVPGRRQLPLTVVSFTARGVVLKRSGGRLKQDLDAKIILHCVSVSNQLQQRTNFCTNFSPKKWGSGDAGSGGRGPPNEKSGGRRLSAPLHPCLLRYWPVQQCCRAVSQPGRPIQRRLAHRPAQCPTALIT